MKFSPLITFTLSILLALLVVFVVDPLEPSTLSTPFMLGLILMWLSLRQDAWVVLLIAIVYCLLDFYATDWFLGIASKINHVPHPYFWFFQRFGLFLVVCVMAVYLSFHREESAKNLSHVQAVLSKLPAPMVISDATGFITYVNEAICTFFGKPAFEILGKRYVDLLMSDTQEGKAMRYYIELFGDTSDSVHEVDLRISIGKLSTKGYVICLGQGSKRSMITVFQVS
jgi:PAS domain S-box-containing protein